ncbi:MAG: Zn-ribbon domain-containing OB-fold protein [Candidatus Helarchaeota archaeon]
MAHVSIPSYWNALPQKYRLVGGRCKECGHINFPPEILCDNCAKPNTQELVELPTSGTVYSYTIIGRGAAPPEFKKMQRKSGAYAIAVVELDNPQKNKINVQLTDCDPFKIKIGTRLTAVFRIIYEQEGVRRYGLKFRPELKNST